MADGRKIPYLIELAADDKKIRQQMAKINWEELLGSKGKGFGDVLVSDTKEAKDQIKRTLGGLDIDWSKILGAKEIGQLEQAVAKALTKSRKEIELFAASGDTTGLEKTIEYVSALGDELKGLGSNFDAADLARRMVAFMKVLTPLTAKFEELSDEPKKVEAAFDRLFTGIATSAKSVDLGKTFDVSGKIKIAMQGLKATNDEIREATESLEKYRNVVAKLSGDNPATIKLAQDVAGLNQQLDEQMRIEEQLAAKNKTNSAQYAATLKNIMAIENARLKLKEKPTTDYTGMEIREDFGYYEEQINKVVERISKKMEEVEGKLANAVDESFAEIISKQISDIKLSVSLSEQAENQFINEINAFVKKVNQAPIEKVKIQIDDAANVIEDQTKRAYGSNPADEDAATTELVKKTDDRFIEIAKTIGKKQKGILANTQKWRSEMIKAMQIGKDDLNFQFGWDGHLKESADSLFNKLQEYFEQPEYALDIKFNTEKIARDLKASIEAEGIELGIGGGTANIDAKSLMSMLHSLLYGGAPVLTSAHTSGTSDSSVPKEIANETDDAVDSSKEYVKVLDETTLHIDKVIESLRVFAKEANKANASKGSKAIASRLTNMGIDIGAIKNGASDTAIIQMLQTALMSKDEMGKAQGASLVGKIEGMMQTYGMDSKKGSGKIVDILAKDIMELFNINELETELEEELIRRSEQLEIWKGIAKPGKALAALGNVRSTKKKIRTPAMEQIDEAIKYFEMAEEDTAPLQKLKEARQKFEDNGETDEAKKEFEKAALVFYDETKVVFNRLKDRWGDFKGVVQAEGRRPVNIDPKGAYPTRILEIPDDAVIAKVDIFEVFKTIRDIGFRGSSSRRESSEKKAEFEQQRVTYDPRTPNYIVKKPKPKRDVRYEDIEYDKFKTQESGRLPQEVALDATIESLEKRVAEIPELVERIEESKKNIAQLEGIKQQIESEISNLQVQDLPEFQMNAFEQYSKRDSSIKQVLKNASNALGKNDILDAGDISKLDNEQQSLVGRLKAITTNIHNDSEASQELADKIAEIVEAKKLSKEELEIARSNAAQRGDKTRVDLYGDLLFNRASVDNRLGSYQTQKSALDENIGKNKNYAQKLIAELDTSKSQSADKATKEAETLASQLIEAKERLYSEAKTYANILNDSSADDKTRETALGQLQETLRGLNHITGKFATIQAYVPETSLYNSSQQNNVDKWNKKYTNSEVRKLEKELNGLEKQLKTEEDEVKVAELKKKIANTKRNLTRLKKNVPDNVSSKKQTELGNIERQLSEERSKLTADKNQKRVADKAASDLQSIKQDSAFLTKYNELLEKEKLLLEEVNKLKREGADKSVIDSKTEELKQATKEADKFLKDEASSVGKLEKELNALEKQLKDEKDEAKVEELKTEIANTKNQLKTVKDRIAYARESAVEYQAQLHTAYRKRSVMDRGIQELDDEEANLTKYGLSGRVGSRARRRALSKATSEYMSSDEVRAQEEAIRKNEQLSWEQRDQQLKELRQRLREEFAAKFDDTNVQQDELDRIATEREIIETGSTKETKKGLAEAQNKLKEALKSLNDIKSDTTLTEEDREHAIQAKQKEINGISDEIQSYQNRINVSREELDKIIKDLQSQKKVAMRYGALSDDDLKNDKYLKQNEQYHKNILDLQSDRVKLERELENIKADDSLDEKKQEKEIKSKQKAIDAINQEIQRNQALIDNRVKLMELHKQEKEESKQTPEEKALLATEKLVGMKQSLAQAEEKVTARRVEYESAKGTENEVKMLEALDNQIKKRDRIQEQIANTEKKIERLGQVTQKTEEVRGEVASTVEGTTSVDGGLLGLIKEAVGEVNVGNVDLTKVEEILSKILAVLSGNGVVGSARNSEMDAKLARIKELEAKQQLANEQKKTAETVKQVENAKKTTTAPTKQRGKILSPERDAFYESELKYQPKELIPDKAQEEAIALKKTLDEMYTKGEAETVEFMNQQVKLANLLSALRSKLGKGKAPADEWKTYVSELLGNTDNVLIGNVGKRDYKSKLKALGVKDETQSAQKVVKAKQEEVKAEVKITEEKKKQEKITFTRKEKNELKKLKDETKDYNPNASTGAGSESSGFATEDTLRAILEVLGKISTNGVPKSGGKTKKSQESSYDTEQDYEGATELERRVGALKGKFKDAISVGYLDENNADLAAFNKQLDDIENSDGTVEQLEEMRKKALALGDVVSKTVAQNKKLYTGTTEMNAAERQYNKLDANGVLDQADLKMVEAYKNKYDEIITTQKKWQAQDNGKGLLREEAQKELRKTALEAQNLGKELEKAANNSERLKQAIDNSGTFNGQKIGAEFKVMDETKVYDEMVAKLKELGAEHIKVDRVRKIATGTIRHNDRTVSDLTVEYDKLRGSLARYQKQERESLTGIPAFLSGFQKKFNSIMQYLSMTMSIHQVIAELRKGVQYVREIDLALTELKKVTDETEETYDRFLDTAAKTGARLGTTISAVTEATATFAKLGYTMEQATEMAESAIVYKNVGDNIASTEDAANSIISTMKGFRLEASESMRIVDRFNEVGNKFAITSQGIGEALRLSASALSEGGNSLDESIGLITAANEVVNDPSSVGTALKTLTLRLRGSKTELQEMGEDVSDMATTTSQLQAKLLALTGGKVDIMLDANTFKNSTQILREMAEAWEDMTDIQRASALELMGGKRQANVLSALIQNFDTVEKVIETSANSAGSALKENERYLDSIQGKIDQFNNAMQAMWSDTLDSDLVKWFVGLGTELIKIVDAIGLIPSILMAILTYKLAIGAIKMFDLTSLGTYIGMLFTANGVTEVQGLLVNKVALAQKLLNSTLIQAQAARMGLTAADLAGYSVTQLLTLGVKGLAAGFKNLWIAMGPVGWAILAIIGAATAFTLIFNAVHKTTEELAEELSNLKSELQDIESEIDTLNSELETTQERMAELIAMPSLSFVEQEELENLKAQTAELERQLELQNMLAKSKKAEVVKATEKYINRAWDSEGLDKTYYLAGSEIKKDEGWNGFWNKGVNTKTALTKAINSYNIVRKTQEKYDAILAQWNDDGSNKELLEKYGLNDSYTKGYVETLAKENRERLQPIADGINMVFADENFDDLEYGMSDEINAFLDELYAFQYKWQEAQGISAKSSAIASIFDDTSSDSIKKLKEDLSEIAKDDSLDAAKKQENALALVNKAINSTSGEYDRLKTSMDIVGIKADEVARYFTQMSSMPDSSTVEGLTAQYQKGVEALSKYQGVATNIIAEFTDLDGSVEQITWGSLFDENGETIDTQISKVLQGADETARTEFARIVKSVNEGKMSIEQAMSSFSGSGLVSVSKLIEESFGELNKSVFKGLEDEISGFIDTFGEFSAALEDVASSMDLLHTAQEQYNNSGQVSVKTALELMQSTDQWNKILTVENGKITLNAEAQDVLVQSKLNTVKANLAEAKASIQNQLAQLGAVDATLLSAEASDVTTEAYTIYTNAMNSYSASIAGFGAALGALIEGRFGDILGDFQGAYNATKEIKTYENNTSIAALREKLAEVDQMEDFFEGVDTFDEFANNYDFDENPGDKYGEDEDSKTDEKMDAFQREMDYWENRIGANQARYEQLQNEIDLLETKGQKADASFYEEQIKLEGQRLELLNGQKAAAEAHLATLKEGSEEWWEVANTLNDIESELDDVTASIVDLQDAIGEIDAYVFEEFNSRLDDITSKLETIRDLIAPDEEDWFDDEGQWTEEGVAVLGTYIQELETYKNGLAEAEAAYDDYVKEYAKNEEYYAKLGIHSEQELYDKRQELIEQQYDYAQSISDTEQSIVDMYESNIDAIEEYTETLVDSYNDYIDSVKEALEAERDLYDFKKNVQKQSKDIAAIERRIASLSGSTNASDVAERRKLEAELYESRESLNDTYYDHARSAQDEALDAEQTAYEENMNKFVEGLRVSLETATMNMDEFLMGVTSMVMYNADTVLTKYQETNLPLTEELTNPWIKAKEAVGTYSGDALALMNKWTEEGGFFAQFNATGTKNLQSPWTAGSNAAGTFKTSVDTVMEGVVSKIATNVKTASSELSKLYQQILDTEKRAAEADVIVDNTSNPKNVNYDPPFTPHPIVPKPEVKLRGLMKTSREMILGPKSFVDENTETINGTKYYRDSKTGYYYKIGDLNSKRKYDGGRTTGWAIPKGTWFYTKNAKGTTGTKRDEWGLTDEPQFGDELVLIPTPQGNLSYMRKGTGVVPADLTANLMEWGQFTPDSMNIGGGVNVNMINNAVNKPELNFVFDALLKAENITEETLPAVKKLVTQELNRFTRELNYSLKAKGAR